MPTNTVKLQSNKTNLYHVKEFVEWIVGEEKNHQYIIDCCFFMRYYPFYVLTENGKTLKKPLKQRTKAKGGTFRRFEKKFRSILNSRFVEYGIPIFRESTNVENRNKNIQAKIAKLYPYFVEQNHDLFSDGRSCFDQDNPTSSKSDLINQARLNYDEAEQVLIDSNKKLNAAQAEFEKNLKKRDLARQTLLDMTKF